MRRGRSGWGVHVQGGALVSRCGAFAFRVGCSGCVHSGHTWWHGQHDILYSYTNIVLLSWSDI